MLLGNVPDDELFPVSTGINRASAASIAIWRSVPRKHGD